MRLLLLGCTGFIGRELVPQLLKSGHHLTIISRKSRNKFWEANSPDQIVHLQIDPSNPNTWKRQSLINILQESNVIINLAGEPIAEKRWTKEHCQKIKNSRISTTTNLINAINALKRPPQLLINGSAIGFYGTSQNEEFDENNQSGKDFLAELCSEWEAIARKKHKSTRLVILRIGIVLEKDGGALGKMLPIFRTGFGGPLGNGKQWMSWIHRTDLCQIIEQALSEKDWEGIMNAVSPNPSRMSDFSQCLGETLGRPNLLPVPAPLLKLVLGDGANVVLEGQNVLCKRLKELNFEFQYPYLKKALKNITDKN